MQIEVKRSTDYWDYDNAGAYSRKQVPDDFVELSEDLYYCDDYLPGFGNDEKKIVRLISGVRGCTELGWHFNPDWVSVCPIHSEYAIFRGVRRSMIKKVDATNDTLFDILRET